jgi:hypothetical protein
VIPTISLHIICAWENPKGFVKRNNYLPTIYWHI